VKRASIITLCGLLVASMGEPATGAPPPVTTPGQTMTLLLTVRIEQTDVVVESQNPTDQPVRVWRLGNSWGDRSWSLRLRTSGAHARTCTLRPTNQGYTRNVPGSIEIPAHGKQEIRLTPSRREWTAGEDLQPLEGVPVNVEAVLDIVPTPEATSHHVAVGRVESTPVVSQPPHAWLFAAASAH
jgi:hypothetical protein